MTSGNTKKSLMRVPAIALSSAALSLLLAGSALAERSAKEVIEAERRIAEAPFESRFSIDDADPERKVPTPAERDIDPISFGHYLMNLSDKAEAAGKRGDHVAEAKYYGAIGNAVPENAVGFVKMCAAYESAGLRPKAQQACREALDHAGVTLADYGHYAALVLSEPGALGTSQVNDLDAVVAHLRTSAANSTLATQIGCDLAVRLNESPRLARCVSDMRKQTPGDPEILSYEWALAVQHKNFDAAESIVQRAKQRHFEKAGAMELATRELASPWRRVLRWMQAQTPVPALGATSGVLLALLATLAYRQRHKHGLNQ